MCLELVDVLFIISTVSIMDTNVAKPNDSTDLIISTLDNIHISRESRCVIASKFRCDA